MKVTDDVLGDPRDPAPAPKVGDRVLWSSGADTGPGADTGTTEEDQP